MKRLLVLTLTALLAIGGLAACSSDSSDSSATSTTASDSSDSGSSSGDLSSRISQYCDDVNAFVEKAKAAGTDPSKLAALTGDATQLASDAASLGQDVQNASASELQEFDKCQQSFTSAQ